MAEYALEFDIPFQELDEPGWSQEVMFSGLDRNRDLEVGENLWYEAKTGTLCLQPVHANPHKWFDAETDSLRVAPDEILYLVDNWNNHPVVGMPETSTGTNNMLRSHLTLSQTLVDLAISGTRSVLQFIDAARPMVPIVETKSAWEMNAGIGVILEVFGSPQTFHRQWLAIAFGDFLLAISTNGMDLFWSHNGTNTTDSYIFQKHFSRFPDLTHGATVMTTGMRPCHRHHLTILPFGRANIWFVMESSAGIVFSDVYRHQPAVYDEAAERFEITQAGTVAVYADSMYKSNLGVGLHRIGYATSGNYTNMRYRTVPYAPTAAPQVTPRWTRTLGTPSVSMSLLDENEAPWVSTGGHSMWKAQVDMLGDGTCTPWVDGLTVEFPETYRTVTPGTPFTVGQQYFEKLSPGRGEEWDDEKVSVSIRDDASNPNVSSLSLRSEIGARLLIDSQPYGYYWFKRPKTICNQRPVTRGEYDAEKGTAVESRHNLIHLSGVNFGVARIRAGRFWFPPSYGGLSHPAAVRRVLNHRGFADAYVVTDADDDIRLPVTTRQGEGTDTDSKTELKSQPEMNAPVEEFLTWIRETFSGNPRWALRYRSDGKWHYQRCPKPTTATVTFYKTATAEEITAGRLWYEDNLEMELEPPEANALVVFGETDTKEIIAQPGMALDSISYAGEDKPLNYIGFERRVTIIDKSLNTPELLTAFVTAGLPILSEAILYVSWRGPFAPTLDIGDGAQLEGVGLVQVLSIQPEADSPRRLEMTASTAYSGRLVQE